MGQPAQLREIVAIENRRPEGAVYDNAETQVHFAWETYGQRTRTGNLPSAVESKARVPILEKRDCALFSQAKYAIARVHGDQRHDE